MAKASSTSNHWKMIDDGLISDTEDVPVRVSVISRCLEPMFFLNFSLSALPHPSNFLFFRMRNRLQ